MTGARNRSSSWTQPVGAAGLTPFDPAIFVPSDDIAVHRFPFRHDLRYRATRKLSRLSGLPTSDGRFDIRTPAGRRHVSYRRWTSDEGVVEQIFGQMGYDLTRLPRFRDADAFLRTLHAAGKRPLIIDAGANIGVSSLFFALSYPSALIVAIEPEQGNYDLLCRNVEGLNVVCLKAALASESGSMTIVDPGTGHWGYRTEYVPDGDIPCLTMAALYRQYAADRTVPFIVKLDIEGAEEDLFSRDVGWIDDTPLLAIELHDWLRPKSASSASFLRSIAGLDRDFLYLGENIFSIDNRPWATTGRQAPAGASETEGNEKGLAVSS